LNSDQAARIVKIVRGPERDLSIVAVYEIPLLHPRFVLADFGCRATTTGGVAILTNPQEHSRWHWGGLAASIVVGAALLQCQFAGRDGCIFGTNLLVTYYPRYFGWPINAVDELAAEDSADLLETRRPTTTTESRHIDPIAIVFDSVVSILLLVCTAFIVRRLARCRSRLSIAGLVVVISLAGVIANVCLCEVHPPWPQPNTTEGYGFIEGATLYVMPIMSFGVGCIVFTIPMAFASRLKLLTRLLRI
jgi:hypothetical protein